MLKQNDIMKYILGYLDSKSLLISARTNRFFRDVNYQELFSRHDRDNDFRQQQLLFQWSQQPAFILNQSASWIAILQKYIKNPGLDIEIRLWAYVCLAILYHRSSIKNEFQNIIQLMRYMYSYCPELIMMQISIIAKATGHDYYYDHFKKLAGTAYIMINKLYNKHDLCNKMFNVFNKTNTDRVDFNYQMKQILNDIQCEKKLNEEIVAKLFVLSQYLDINNKQLALNTMLLLLEHDDVLQNKECMKMVLSIINKINLNHVPHDRMIYLKLLLDKILSPLNLHKDLTGELSIIDSYRENHERSWLENNYSVIKVLGEAIFCITPSLNEQQLIIYLDTLLSLLESIKDYNPGVGHYSYDHYNIGTVAIEPLVHAIVAILDKISLRQLPYKYQDLLLDLIDVTNNNVSCTAVAIINQLTSKLDLNVVAKYGVILCKLLINIKSKSYAIFETLITVSLANLLKLLEPDEVFNCYLQKLMNVSHSFDEYAFVEYTFLIRRILPRIDDQLRKKILNFFKERLKGNDLFDHRFSLSLIIDMLLTNRSDPDQITDFRNLLIDIIKDPQTRPGKIAQALVAFINLGAQCFQSETIADLLKLLTHCHNEIIRESIVEAFALYLNGINYEFSNKQFDQYYDQLSQLSTDRHESIAQSSLTLVALLGKINSREFNVRCYEFISKALIGNNLSLIKAATRVIAIIAKYLNAVQRLQMFSALLKILKTQQYQEETYFLIDTIKGLVLLQNNHSEADKYVNVLIPLVKNEHHFNTITEIITKLIPSLNCEIINSIITDCLSSLMNGLMKNANDVFQFIEKLLCHVTVKDKIQHLQYIINNIDKKPDNIAGLYYKEFILRAITLDPEIANEFSYFNKDKKSITTTDVLNQLMIKEFGEVCSEQHQKRICL